LEIIHNQKDNGISFDFIGADGFYGNDVNFASEINKMGYKQDEIVLSRSLLVMIKNIKPPPSLRKPAA